jgi:hypothetical protein
MGITLPILPEHLPRFFEHQKTVFVKFIGAGVIPTRLRQGSKLFFYESGGKKQIVGEAEIAGLSTGRIEEILAKYRDELFLTAPELEEYVGARRKKRMIVFVLSHVRRYAVPFQLKKSVSMAGQYMTKGMFEEMQRPET